MEENKMKSKLEVTLKQWKEIYNKEMGISPDLRNIEKTVQAFEMILKLEAKIKRMEMAA
jgi:hypothetical protein